MRLTRDNLHNVSVKVNGGSGTLLNIDGKAYVLTSNHCIEEQEKHLRNFDKTVTYKALGHFSDEKNDIALLRVKSSVEFAVKGTTDYSVGDSVAAYGFPFQGEATGTPMNAKVSKVSDGLVIETNLTYGNGAVNDDEHVIERIVGWSGSAVFKLTDEGDLFLIGIVDSVTDKDLKYQTIRCQTLTTILEFIASCELGSFEVVEKLESNDDKKEQGEGDIVTINSNIIGIGIVTGGSVNQTTNSITHNYNNTKGTIISGNNARVTIDEQEENLEQKLKKKLYKFLGMKF